MAANSTGSIAVALVVGVAIGVGIGYAVAPDGGSEQPAVAAAPSAAPSAAPAAPTAQPAQNPTYNVPINDFQPTKGPKDAKVTIVEVSDFECPFCNRVNPTVQQILETYPNDVRIVWANNPLSFHKNALPAAEAAYAAHEQGKFWEFHDLLFENQQKLGSEETYIEYAKQLGLNVDKFKKDLQNPEYQKIIDADMAQGSKVGVRGTPAFFINGERLVGAQPASKFKEVIDRALAEAK